MIKHAKKLEKYYEDRNDIDALIVWLEKKSVLFYFREDARGGGLSSLILKALSVGQRYNNLIWIETDFEEIMVFPFDEETMLKQAKKFDYQEEPFEG